MEKIGEEAVKTNEKFLTQKRKKEKEMRQKSEGGDGNLKKAKQRSEGDRCERQQKNMTQMSRCDKESNVKLIRIMRDMVRRKWWDIRQS